MDKLLCERDTANGAAAMFAAASFACGEQPRRGMAKVGEIVQHLS